MFYVYEHWRPDTGVCFYVGKGKNNRSHTFKRDRNNRYLRVVKFVRGLGLDVIVKFVKKDLSEERAFEIEKQRIAFWRRKGVELTNATDGGEGPSGYRFSAKARMRIREIQRKHIAKLCKENIGRKHTKEARAKIKEHWEKRCLIPVSVIARKRMSEAQKGRKHSKETRIKISIKQKASWNNLRRNKMSIMKKNRWAELGHI